MRAARRLILNQGRKITNQSLDDTVGGGALLRNYSNIIDQYKIRSLYIFFLYILWIFKRSDLILVVKDLISAYACTHACRERLIDGLDCWKSRKASYPQQAEAKPQYHHPKWEGIESDCKEQKHTLAAFLPKPPNTGFGDVRCRIGAERLFIYLFYSFFHLFGSFSIFVVYL